MEAVRREAAFRSFFYSAGLSAQTGLGFQINGQVAGLDLDLSIWVSNLTSETQGMGPGIGFEARTNGGPNQNAPQAIHCT